MSRMAPKLWILALVGGALLASAWPLWALLGPKPGSFAIRWVQVSGPFERVSAEQVRSAVTPHLGGGYFALDLPAIQRAVQALPWVAKVEVRKRWPDTLEVQLSEHSAVVRWGEGELLDERGRAFAVEGGQSIGGMAQLIGPAELRAELLTFYRDASARLRILDLWIERAEFDPRGGLTLKLSDGAEVVLGRIDYRGRLERLIKAYPALRARAAGRPLAHIDARYTNGVAVRFEPDPIARPDRAPQLADGSGGQP